MAEHDAGLTVQARTEYGGIRRAVLPQPDQRLDHTAAAHLMIILADEIFLAADIQAAQHTRQKRGLIR